MAASVDGAADPLGLVIGDPKRTTRSKTDALDIPLGAPLRGEKGNRRGCRSTTQK
jgi:hypothetical protein